MTKIQWTDEKWCTKCKSSHPRSEFGKDNTRYDGLSASCLKSRRVQTKKKPGYAKGTYRHGWLVEARSGDQQQARRRVNYLVEQGRIPHPNSLACSDCGHSYSPGERRHEYDHHEGYQSDKQLSVQAVCSSCHHSREERRRWELRLK